MDIVNRTDEQWELYEQATVEIDLPVLEQLITAAELLSRGARLDHPARKVWEIIFDQANSIYQVAAEEAMREANNA